MRFISSAAVFVLLAILVFELRAEDWPQWMGPERDGLTTETGLLESWPEGGPKQVWLFDDCGVGYSGPAVVGDRLYIMGSRGGTTQLICLASDSGKELWAKPLGPELDNGWGNGPRGTPTVDGDRVYCLAGRGNLVCLDSTSGDEQWRVNLQDDLGGKIPVWGYSESPLVDGDQVVCTPGGDQGALAAFDKKSGKLLWRSTGNTDEAHYSSIIKINHRGESQYVQLMPNHIVGIEPATGKVLWQTEWPGKVAVIPTPIYRDGYVYVTSGYGVGCRLVKIADDGRSVETVYDNKVMKNHHGGVILVGDAVYGHSDPNGWICQDFESGDDIWRERSKLGKGAISYADGHFYLQSENEGDIVLIDATTDEWREQGRFTLSPQTKLRKPSGRIWTHPVVANGRLYLRDQDLLFSFDISK
jgi:hypothetical protein